MNGDRAFIEQYLSEFDPGVDVQKVAVVLFPAQVHIGLLGQKLSGSKIQLGAQNVASQESGAFTGEVSAEMLADMQCSYALVGHSERRNIFGESIQETVDKVGRLIEKKIVPVLCVGETLQERDSGLAEETVAAQLNAVLSAFDEESLATLVVAYEPVWAIGTGKTATPEIAQSMHAFIRQLIAKRSVGLAESCSLLYGGSVNAENASQLLAQKDIDGCLVGGASLKVKDFTEICETVG